jgi:hypothetical protein
MSDEVQVLLNLKTKEKFTIASETIEKLWPTTEDDFQKLFPGLSSISKPYKDPIGDRLAEYLVTEKRSLVITMYMLQKFTGTVFPISIKDSVYYPTIFKYRSELLEILEALGIDNADTEYLERIINLIFIKLTGGMYTSAGTD